MTSIHYHYDQLTQWEREAVNEAYVDLTATLKANGVFIHGDDTAERVVDAIAAGVIASRASKAVKPLTGYN